MEFPSDIARRLSHLLASEQAASRLPSVSAAYVRDGRVVWADAVGTIDGRRDGLVATPETQYRIGSITKVFVAVLVLRLVEQGRLDLDAHLDEVLPGTSIGSTTIADLLSQRSGLRAETEGPWWERSPGQEWSSLERQLAIRHPARGRFHYSNVGFAVLALAVGRLHATSWTEALRTEILDPLGLTRTTTRPVAPHAVGLAVHPYADLVLPEPEHDAGAMGPAGQLWSTTGDLARFAAFLHTGSAVLSPAGVELMRVPRAINDDPGQPWTTAYGYGLQVFNRDGRRLFGHGGSMPGFQAILRVDTATGDAVIIMTNSTVGWSGDLCASMFDLVGTECPSVADPWSVDADQTSLVELTGTWYWGPAPLVMHARAGGGLELLPVGQGRGSRFRPTGRDTWEGLDGYYLGEPLRLVRRDGRPSHWDLASFRLTRTPYDPAADVPGGVDGDWS